MKFNQYIWDLYKNSPQGIASIKYFATAGEEVIDYELVERYNPIFARFTSKDKFVDFFETTYTYGISEYDRPKSIEDAKDIYSYIICCGLSVEGEYIIYPNDYETMLQINTHISLALYFHAPEFFFPNLFMYRFFDLKKITDVFEIDLPQMPKKSDYKARCMYYWELCTLFYDFRIKNNLSSAELCSFLYDFSTNFIEKEILNIPKPSQAWFIGGKIDQIDIDAGTPFWQGNAETKKGDILVHYETSPISAITKIWIAQTDGVIDPFFHYYSNVYIGNRIEVPSITLKELKADSYFSKHTLVRKSFQGVNGWTLTSDDYVEILRIIRDKGFNLELLPTLYTPTLPQNLDIKCEKDVEKQLLEYYLTEMGLLENRDYIRQLPVRAGTVSRVYPDYALHYNDRYGYECTKVLIEAKYHIKNNNEMESAFVQARSYANLLEASVIIICDKNCLMIYEKQASYDRDRYIKYYWDELRNPDVYIKFKNLLLITK